jgi:hypothetical protein
VRSIFRTAVRFKPTVRFRPEIYTRAEFKGPQPFGRNDEVLRIVDLQHLLGQQGAKINRSRLGKDAELAAQIGPNRRCAST